MPPRPQAPPFESAFESFKGSAVRPERYRWIGGLCLIAALAIWGGFSLSEKRSAHEAAIRTLAAFETDEAKAAKQAAAEYKALQDLIRANRETRSALLQTALQNPPDAMRMKGREQALAISLSQVKSAEAHSLFRNVIFPALNNSADPAIVAEALQLMRRWSIDQTLSVPDRDGIAGMLVDKMLKTEDAEVIGPLSDGVVMLAPGVSPPAGEAAAWKLAIRSISDNTPAVSDTRLPALLALERALGSDSAGDLATRLVERMLAERNGTARRLLAMEAKDPDSKIAPQVAKKIAGQVVDQMTRESDPISMGAWSAMLESLKENIDSGAAGELALRLAPAAVAELGFSSLEPMFSGWRALIEKATPQQSQEIVTMLAGVMKLPLLDSHALRRAAACVASVNLAQESFAPIGAILTARMQATTDPAVLAELGSAVALLRTKLPASAIDEASTLLVRRMAIERDPEALGPMAGAVDDLDESISKPKVVELARILAERMRTEGSSNALLNLGVGFIALGQQTDNSSSEDLAAPLLARILGESQPPALRTLAFSLGSVASGVAAAKISAAGGRIVTVMATKTEADVLRQLTAALCAIKDKAGSENLDKAASVLSARITLEDDLADIRSLTESLHALGGSVDAKHFLQPALSLSDRMLAMKDPAQIQSMSRTLGVIVPDLNDEASARVASKLVERIAVEKDPALLRAYGTALATLPAGSISQEQVPLISGIYSVLQAPCQVVTRVKGVTVSDLAHQILNPFCVENGWTQVVIAFDDTTRKSIVRQSGAALEDESLADFKSLIVADDDDEASPGSVVAAEGNGIDVDFDKLSQAVEPFQVAEPANLAKIAAEFASGVLLLVGIALLVLSRKKRAVLT